MLVPFLAVGRSKLIACFPWRRILTLSSMDLGPFWEPFLFPSPPEKCHTTSPSHPISPAGWSSRAVPAESRPKVPAVMPAQPKSSCFHFSCFMWVGGLNFISVLLQLHWFFLFFSPPSLSCPNGHRASCYTELHTSVAWPWCWRGTESFHIPWLT